MGRVLTNSGLPAYMQLISLAKITWLVFIVSPKKYDDLSGDTGIDTANIQAGYNDDLSLLVWQQAVSFELY